MPRTAALGRGARSRYRQTCMPLEFSAGTTRAFRSADPYTRRALGRSGLLLPTETPAIRAESNPNGLNDGAECRAQQPWVEIPGAVIGKPACLGSSPQVQRAPFAVPPPLPPILGAVRAPAPHRNARHPRQKQPKWVAFEPKRSGRGGVVGERHAQMGG